MKIVINGCYGGFSVSLAAARRMAELGDEKAIEAIRKYDNAPTEGKHRFENRWYGYDWYDDRTNKALVQAVEELGKDASNKYSSIYVVEIPDDVDWYIDEYDGIETVHEKHRSWS